MHEILEALKIGGPYGISIVLGVAVISLWKKLETKEIVIEELHKNHAVELSEIHDNRVEEMEKITIAAQALAGLVDRFSLNYLSRNGKQ